MATKANIMNFGELPSYKLGTDPYDPDKLGLGPTLYQKNGVQQEEKYIGPPPVGVARPMEQSVGVPGVFPWAMQWQNDADGEIDWIFLADNATAANTRRIVAYTYNRRTSMFEWRGIITCTLPPATAHTVRAFRMTYDCVKNGTVSVTGSTVTGSGTNFTDERLCVGNRIGFGTTDPTKVTQWYEISAVTNNTTITIIGSPGTLPGGTPYVIEDLRAVMVTTNATPTNGGVFIIKGLSLDTFNPVGFTIPAATNTDNLRACYWLTDAVTLTNTVALGAGLGPRVSATSQRLYVLDVIANPVCFVYNIRQPLSPTSGRDTANAFQFKTGSGGAVTGTPTQQNNGRLATLNHGPHAGIETLYFTTSTRVYAAPTSQIQAASTTWLSGGSAMTEQPPGTVNTFALAATFQSLEYMPSIDRFIIPNSGTTRAYVTQYRTDAGQLDRLTTVNLSQNDQGQADLQNTVPAGPSNLGIAFSIWAEGGICYMAVLGTTANNNRLYAVPMGVDWEYTATSGSRAISPRMQTPNARRLLKAYMGNAQVLGGMSGTNLGNPPEPSRIYYRTAGIADNSGAWTLIPPSGNINAAPTTEVQLMAEFRMIGALNIPPRLYGVAVMYDDFNQDEHWLGSKQFSDPNSSTFAFYFTSAYGSGIPKLAFEVRNPVGGSVLYTDDSETQDGLWEKSTDDGVTWGPYDTADRGNAITYIRIQPSSIASNVKAIGYLRVF